MLKQFLHNNLLEVGCDEAGRGCLAGPVFAAAVILPPDFLHPELNDSKKLSEKLRIKLREIIEYEAISYGIASADPGEIDSINILRASFLAMHRAISKLTINPEYLLIDGNRFNPYPGIPHSTIIKGDSEYMSIAAASILAKTYRDDYMRKIHKKYPVYSWDSNKGYPTVKHRAAIREFGPSHHHRKTFTLLPPQYSLKFED
ncbi:ribonuclease HII [Bacteroidota bacterium]